MSNLLHNLNLSYYLYKWRTTRECVYRISIISGLNQKELQNELWWFDI